MGSRCSFKETLKRDPHCGHLFVFRGRRGDLIKCLWSDGRGLCLFAKRLGRGRLLWPSTAGGTVRSRWRNCDDRPIPEIVNDRGSGTPDFHRKGTPS